jgi:hypothetical protein
MDVPNLSVSRCESPMRLSRVQFRVVNIQSSQSFEDYGNTLNNLG